MYTSRQRHAGMANMMFPGYKERIWSRLPKNVKEFLVVQSNNAFEREMTTHKKWQAFLTRYKAIENRFIPSSKFRKPAVDWRRQIARGTVHTGRWYEGPPIPGSDRPSDYTPGNTYDRLQNVKAPFTEEEWEERKKYRSYDLVQFGYGLIALFAAYRLMGEWPVVWCEERVA